MRYTTNYDIGDRKRGRGINEDSLAMTVFEQGHRDGYRGQRTEPEAGDDPSEADAEASDEDAAAGVLDLEDDDTQIYGVEPTDADGGDTDEGATADQAEAQADPRQAEEPASADEPVGRPVNRSAGVFVLADGAGGHDAGDTASYIATTVISEHLAPVAINTVRSHPEGFDIDISPEVLPTPLGEEDIQTGLENAIIDAHREILRYAAQSGTQSYTTVVAGVYADGQLHLGWVGDSRAYLVNDERADIARLTKDHAAVQEMEDDGEIDTVEAHVHPNGNEITRALGGAGHDDPARATVDVDTRSVQLFAEDTVLVTSDGLIDAQTDAPQLYERYIQSGRSEAVGQEVLDAVVTDEEIRDVLLSADSMETAVTEYVTLANERGGKDNISVLLFQDEALPATPTGGLPIRAVDPDVDVSERQTVLFSDE